MQIYRLRAILVCGFAVLAVSCAGIPPVDECDVIVIDMPHGGRRIAVEPDGSGTYSYGALPTFGNFEAGTFVFEDVYDDLRGVAESKRRDTPEEFGTVKFLTDRGSEGTLYFVYDRELLTDLLDTAFANRLEPPNAWEIDAVQALDQIWLSEEKAP